MNPRILNLDTNDRVSGHLYASASLPPVSIQQTFLNCSVCLH